MAEQDVRADGGHKQEFFGAERVVDEPPVGAKGDEVGADHAGERQVRDALLGSRQPGMDGRAGALDDPDGTRPPRALESGGDAEFAQ